jgi:hypothetical protein
VSCTPNGGIEVCTVPVTFIPTLPGQRKDALFLMNGTTQLASVLLGGIGQGPLSLVQPGVVTNPVVSNPNYLYNSTVDENGTAYVLGQNSNTVYSVTKAGVKTQLPITWPVNASGPNAAAIDGAGVLYIAHGDYGSSLITYNTVTGVQGTLAVAPPSPYAPCPFAYPGPLEGLYGLAVDDIGDVYTLETLCNQVFELRPNGTYVTTAISPAITQPGELAVDSSGNVFVSGYTINEIPAMGTQSEINTTGASEGIAVDAAGTLYATRYSVPPFDIAMLPASSYATPLAGLDGGTSGETVSPLGLSLGSDGTLIVGNYTSLDRVDRSQGAINFGEQTVNVTSASQQIQIYNGGNMPLSLSAININGAGFAIVGQSSLGACSNTTMIPAGSLCTISVTVTPPNNGIFSGTLTITSNSLNSSGGVTQSVALSGFTYGPYLTESPSPIAFGNQSAGTSSTPQQATLTNNGNAYNGCFSVGSITAPAGFTVTQGTCGTSPVQLYPTNNTLFPGPPAGATSCSLNVTFAPPSTQTASSQSYGGTVTVPYTQCGQLTNYSATFAVSGTGVSALTAQAINFTQPATPETYSSGLTIPLVAAGGASGNAVVFTIDGSSTGTGSIAGSTLTVTAVGSFVIDANQAGNATYSAAPQVQRTVVVSQASQTITFAQPTSPVIYSGTSVNVPLSATGGASGNAVVFTIDGSSTGTGTISGSTLTVTAVGSFVIDANQAGNSNYSAAPQVQRTVAVNQASQAITFTQPTSPVTYSSGLTIPLVATGGASGNAVVFTIDGSSTGTGTISGSTLTVTSVGSFVIDANQAGNSSYSAAPQVQRTVVVSQASQTINFTQPTSPVIYSGTSVNVPLSATGGASGNAVVFTIDGSSTGTGTISGSTLTVTSVGTFVIDANQAGNTDYTAAPQVQRTVVANAPTPQAINFTQPTTPVTYSSGLTIPLVATGGASGNPVVFTIDGSSTGTGTISGSTLTVTAVGSFVIDANQAGNSSYSAAPQVQRTEVVNQATQAITFTQPNSPVVYSGTSVNVPLSATGGASGNAVVFTIDSSSTGTGTISGSTLTVTSVGTFVIDANQAGNTNYSAATQVQRTVVANAPGTQTINFTQPATPVTYSSGLTIPLVATGGASGNAVVFTIDGSSTGTGTISGSTLTVTAVGSFVIDANQAGNSSYSAAPQVQRTVVVSQAPQAINFTQPASPVTYSSGLQITLSATGGASGNAVVFTIDASSTAKGSISGSTLTVTATGNLVIDANQAGNTDYSAAPQVQRTVAVNAPAPDFSVASTTPSQSVTAGGSAVYPITVADVGSAFTSAVTLSVSGLPTGATGSFNPASVTPGSTSASSTLTVTIPATASVVRPNLWPMATPVLAVLFMLPFRRWRKVWRGKFLLLVAGLASLACAASLTGCGGGFGFIQSQTYTLTITGTSGEDTHSTTVQLTVQ